MTTTLADLKSADRAVASQIHAAADCIEGLTATNQAKDRLQAVLQSFHARLAADVLDVHLLLNLAGLDLTARAAELAGPLELPRPELLERPAAGQSDARLTVEPSADPIAASRAVVRETMQMAANAPVLRHGLPATLPSSRPGRLSNRPGWRDTTGSPARYAVLRIPSAAATSGPATPAAREVRRRPHGRPSMPHAGIAAGMLSRLGPGRTAPAYGRALGAGLPRCCQRNGMWRRGRLTATRSTVNCQLWRRRFRRRRTPLIRCRPPLTASCPRNRYGPRRRILWTQPAPMRKRT